MLKGSKVRKCWVDYVDYVDAALQQSHPEKNMEKVPMELDSPE